MSEWVNVIKSGFPSSLDKTSSLVLDEKMNHYNEHLYANLLVSFWINYMCSKGFIPLVISIPPKSP